jgi:DNA-binding transcriptional MerR regulator
MARNGIQIGKVSERTGLSIDAIRFYEKQCLLDPRPRTEGGFRLFNAQDIERIQFIRRAQHLGFSLPEIRELLFLQRQDGEACFRVRHLLKAKIVIVRNKIAGLAKLEQVLATRLRKCECSGERASGAGQTGGCPVLREIAERDSHED